MLTLLTKLQSGTINFELTEARIYAPQILSELARFEATLGHSLSAADKDRRIILFFMGKIKDFRQNLYGKINGQTGELYLRKGACELVQLHTMISKFFCGTLQFKNAHELAKWKPKCGGEGELRAAMASARKLLQNANFAFVKDSLENGSLLIDQIRHTPGAKTRIWKMLYGTAGNVNTLGNELLDLWTEHQMYIDGM